MVANMIQSPFKARVNVDMLKLLKLQLTPPTWQLSFQWNFFKVLFQIEWFDSKCHITCPQRFQTPLLESTRKSCRQQTRWKENDQKELYFFCALFFLFLQIYSCLTLKTATHTNNRGFVRKWWAHSWSGSMRIADKRNGKFNWWTHLTFIHWNIFTICGPAMANSEYLRPK